MQSLADGGDQVQIGLDPARFPVGDDVFADAQRAGDVQLRQASAAARIADQDAVVRFVITDNVAFLPAVLRCSSCCPSD